MKKNKLIIIILLVISLIFVQCKSTFPCLPDNIIDAKNISGTYKNESIISPFGSCDLWQCVKPASKIKNDKHLIRLQIKKNKLYAQLIKNNEIVDKKKLKGRLSKTCFVARKRFLIIPILPILWGYNNSQLRISVRDNSLVINEFNENGGVVLIMAGGNNYVNTYEYRRIDLADIVKSK